MRSHLVITGTPSVGKTTLVREAILPYREKSGGFLTLEVRGPDGKRKGFEVMSLPEGRRAVFAGKDLASGVRLNKYGIDTGILDSVGTQSLERALKDEAIRLIVIDEIGAMEAESPAFRGAALRALGGQDKPVLATLRAKSQPFTNEIKQLANLTLVELTRANYPKVKAQVQQWLAGVLRE